jgi:ATP/maltotriose-dependent transcriptional regulator MalT
VSGGTDTLPVIGTKLHQPRITGNLVSRPRPLIPVPIPGGYGKTTLLCSWPEESGCRRACALPTQILPAGLPGRWLSLSEDDGDLSPFLTFPSAAIHAMFLDACGHTRAILRGPHCPQSPSWPGP